jgi:hypothetical protein
LKTPSHFESPPPFAETAKDEHLHARVNSVGAEYVKQINMKYMRSKAEAAWRAKNYFLVVELYGPARKDLTEVEAKRLTYAEQQVLTADGIDSRSSSRNRR